MINPIKKLYALIARPAPAAPDTFGGFGMADTGPAVTTDTAQNYSGVWACAKIISESMACMPAHVVERGATWRREVDHPVARLLNRRPNDEVDAAAYRESLIRDLLFHGNHYAEIERTRGGEVIALWRLDPARVSMKRDSSGLLVYDIEADDGKSTLERGEVFHVVGPSLDGLIGMSTISQARAAISLGMSVDQFGLSFFSNGAQPSGVIINRAGRMDAPGVKNLLDTFNRRHQGARRAHRVGYLDGDMEYKSLSVPPEDAQFIESRRFNILEICRWFRVPPHKLAELERSTHTNIEAQNIEFVTDTLLPWAVKIEAAVNTQLLDPDGALVLKINPGGLLRGDSAGRAAFYSSLHSLGAISANEIRALEDMAPIEGGDKHYIQLNLTAVEDADDEAEARAMQPPPPPPPDDDELEDDEQPPEDDREQDLAGPRALAIAETAATYERAALNGLKKMKTTDAAAGWLNEQPALLGRVFRPLALAIHGHDKYVAEAGGRVRAWLLEQLSARAELTPEAAANELRGVVSVFVSDLIRGFKP